MQCAESLLAYASPLSRINPNIRSQPEGAEAEMPFRRTTINKRSMQANAHQNYRPDIDGLRAIAVLAVIAFHASARILPGGFIGVDIFFVISGYLITGLIAKAIDEDRFSFAEFYTRRIKRIFPAYITVTVVTLAFASYLLIPNDYIFYTTSLAASWAFASNIFFSMLSWGYFGQRTEEFPLLHTWSLSVEEQFYFVFPVLLIFLHRYFRKYMLHAIVVLALAFTALSQWKTGELKSYFLLTSRAHELMIGALAYFASQRFPLRRDYPAHLLALLGMVLMLTSLVLINRNTPFPGINSVYPCLGAALLMYAGQREHILSPVLKHKAMVAVGLISYSLYLWHWPIFTFLRYRKIEITLSVGIAAVALAFVLAYLTWKFVENPIRQNKKIQFKRAFVQIYAVPAAAFLAIGLYSYVTEGMPNRFSPEIRELIASYSFARDLTRSCSIRAEDYRKVDSGYLAEHCAFGDMTQKKPEVLLMGDSHADHFKPFVEEMAQQANFKAVFHVQGNCRPTDLTQSSQGAEGEATTCQKRNADLLDLAKNYKYVVLAGIWAGYQGADLEKELNVALDKISKAGATPVIIKDNADHEPDLSKCVLYKKRGWIPASSNCNIPYALAAKTQGPVDHIIDKVKLTHPNALVVDPKRVMCNAEECLTYIGNVALYKDANHINLKASKMLGDQYIVQIGNPFQGQMTSDPRMHAVTNVESKHRL